MMRVLESPNARLANWWRSIMEIGSQTTWHQNIQRLPLLLTFCEVDFQVFFVTFSITDTRVENNITFILIFLSFFLFFYLWRVQLAHQATAPFDHVE
jgi:hypothetical protein